MKNNRLLFFTTLLSLCLVGCNTGNNSSSQQPEPEEGPAVFILAGQSNMNGQTAHSNLQNVLTDLGISDAEALFEGVPEVRTSYFGVGYGEIYGSGIYASNKVDPLAGKYENTKVGMGSNANNMGPEVGLAYKLRDYGTEDKPIYFIKMGISGSGFDQGEPTKGANGRNAVVNWRLDQDPSLYNDFLKPYVENCLELIKEETEMNPVIKGFVWHQGESDTATAKIQAYAERFNALVDQLRTDFGEYATDQDPERIAVIDALIYDGDDTAWGKETSQQLNQVKIDNAAIRENYYCVNTSMKREGGAKLSIGSPGGDSMHYSTEGSFKLGMLYGDAIIENSLLD